MDSFDRIEPETETHRLGKAVSQLVPTATLPLKSGSVAIEVDPEIIAQPGTQLLISLLVNLLARMKGIVRTITLRIVDDPELHPGVPLGAPGLVSGLEQLVTSLSGPKSVYRTEFVTSRTDRIADVRVGIGVNGCDITVGCDAWRAFLGRYSTKANWSHRCPLGPYFAATLAAAELFKRLLRINFGWEEGALIDDVAYSLVDYSMNENATVGRDVSEIELRQFAVAGAGAGGTAALFTLASFPSVYGDIIAVEPSPLKESNLGRYLMCDYAQVHSHLHKLDSVNSFLRSHAPDVCLHAEYAEWHEVSRNWSELTVLATVDTPEARWDVQRSEPKVILDAGVMGLLFAVLRVVPEGWCLECKHQPNPEITWKRRASRWGLPIEEVKRKYYARSLVTKSDIERLAVVQCRPVGDFH